MCEKEKFQLDGQSGRLDQVLTQLYPDQSRSTNQRWIKDGRVCVDDTLQKANYKLTGQECLTVDLPEDEEEEDIELLPEPMDLDIIYEDDDILVINKPAGLVVHPAKGHDSGTLVNGLLHYLSGDLSSGSHNYRPGIVHRIDKDTSGLLVVAKNDRAHQFLSQQLEGHSMGRTYVALVNGPLEADSGTIEMPVRRDPSNRLRWRVDPEGKEAVTHYQVLKKWPYATLVELQLETGRTHQIRIHLEAVGHPIIGDAVYRRNIQNFPGNLSNLKDGQRLHARDLKLVHPTSGEMMQFTCSIPSSMQDLIDQLDAQ